MLGKKAEFVFFLRKRILGCKVVSDWLSITKTNSTPVVKCQTNRRGWLIKGQRWAVADPEQGDSGFVVLGSEDSENEHVVETKRVI